MFNLITPPFFVYIYFLFSFLAPFKFFISTLICILTFPHLCFFHKTSPFKFVCPPFLPSLNSLSPFFLLSIFPSSFSIPSTFTSLPPSWSLPFLYLLFALHYLIPPLTNLLYHTLVSLFPFLVLSFFTSLVHSHFRIFPPLSLIQVYSKPASPHS